MKRAQFYLMAAILLIVVIIGFVSVTNIAKTKKESGVYDLSEKLSFETTNVVNYGVYQQKNVQDLLEDFADLVIRLEPDKDFVFVYGGNEGILVIGSKDFKSELKLCLSGTCAGLDVFQTVSQTSKYDYGEEITVRLNNLDYNFNLERGENFYFIISDEEGGTATGAVIDEA